MGKDLRRIIRIVEVPIYLLTLAIGCLNEGSTFFGLLLLAISVFRLCKMIKRVKKVRLRRKTYGSQ